MSDIQDNIFRDGTSQKFRYRSGLQTDKVEVDGRDIEYFLNYAASLSEILNFYDSSNSLAGDWSRFYPDKNAIPDFLSALPSTQKLAPQIALFIAFTRLMEVLKTDINLLSKQHLEFYFQKVLRFKKHGAIAEKVNLVFEPSSNIPEPFILPAASELLAGKSEDGNPIIFLTEKDLTISKASIAKVSNIMVDKSFQSRVYAAPKADSADGISEPLPKEAPYWNSFGETQSDKSEDERSMIDGKIGFAIASPTLLLKEGTRTIHVRLQCRNLRFTRSHFNFLNASLPPLVMEQLHVIENLLFGSVSEMENAIISAIGEVPYNTHKPTILDLVEHPFKFLTGSQLEHSFFAEATGEKDWFTIENVVLIQQLQSDLVFSIKLHPTDPAIVDYDPAVHKQPINTSLPIIQFNLDHASDDYLYDQLRGIQIKNVSIEVDVKGVTDLLLQSENGPIKPGQPFLPFGAVPTEGSNFYFGSREIFSKKIDELKIALSWANLPKDNLGFQEYYAGYPTAVNNTSFKASVYILNKKAWLPAGEINLFKTDPLQSGQHLERKIYDIPLPLTASTEEYLPDIKILEPSVLRGFARLELKEPDFGHSVFPTVYAEKALLKVSAPLTKLPNVPYTPKISHFSLDYKASTTFLPAPASDPRLNHIYHVEPLGLVPLFSNNPGSLLPQFEQGTLFIGINDLTPPQNLSILFQMVDGSANPDIEVNRRDVKWSYLSEQAWKPLQDVSILLDTTIGLQTSGVVEFSIGNDATNKSAFWANGHYWLKAEFLKDPSGASKVAALFTNGGISSLKKELAFAGVIKEPLQPGTVNQLAVTDPRIKAVVQPFTSFFGKGIEPEQEFNLRVSERLRHKNRAVNLWDYEHIVLEAFPSVYKVKCLPHTGKTMEPAPGSVTLLVIPDLRKRNKINPFEPKVSAVLRSQIAEYMRGHASGVATIFVDNPNYEQVLVEMSVGLLPGYDGSFYGKLLNEELKRFLSPWAYEEGKDIVFGGRIFKSSILSFVEQREYVDYVTNFRLYHLQRGPGIGDMRIWNEVTETPQDFIVRANTIGEEMDFEVVASSPRSILVTAPDHKINVLNPGEFACSGNSADTGIGAMIIEVDFFVF